MSSTSKHTSTPWSAPAWAARNGRHGIYGPKHATMGYAPLAFVQGDKRVTGGDGAENAAFIVRAVNHHDPLVIALKEAVNALAGGLWDYGPGQNEHEKCDEVLARCRAALADAEA